MALSPGRKAITRSNESTTVGNGLLKETPNYSTDKTAGGEAEKRVSFPPKNKTAANKSSLAAARKAALLDTFIPALKRWMTP